MEFLIPLVLGAFMGATISGTFGMAGGSVLLGVMLALGVPYLVTLPIHAAVQLVSNSTRVIAHLSNVRWRPFLFFAVAALPGPIIGLRLLVDLNPDLALSIIGVLILYTVWAPKWGLEKMKEAPAFVTAGVIAGIFGVISGAVGPLVAPFFLRDGFLKEQIIATKALCQSYVHVLKVAAFLGVYPALSASKTLNFDFLEHWQLILPMALATIIGTYLGKYLLKRVSQERFALAYRVLLTVLALDLIVRGVDGLMTAT